MHGVNETARTADFEFAALRQADNYRKAIIREFSPHLRGRVAEVGAGIGQITAEIAEIPGIECLTVAEPDPRFHPYHQGKSWTLVPDRSLALRPEDGWNCIILINVLEHIEKDEEELKCLYERLRSARGKVCILVPARPELYAPIDRDFGHFRRYTRPELERKLKQAGFRLLRCDYFNWAGYFAWGLTMKWMGSRSFSPFGVRLFDRMIFPWIHWMEYHICRPFFGQSLIAVGEADGPDV